MQRKLDIVVSVAIVLIVILFGIRLLQVEFAKKTTRLESMAILARPLEPGHFLVSPVGYSWKSHPETLVMALRYGCIHCERNMSFYREILKKADDLEQRGVYPICFFPDDSFIAKHDLSEHNLEGIPYLARVNFKGLHIFGTPTLLLVRSDGSIVQTWIGELSATQQQQVMNAIR